MTKSVFTSAAIFLLAKMIPWHFHVFHTESAQMGIWNAASNSTDRRVLALAQPQLGAVGGRISKWRRPGSNGKQECLTISQRMDRAGPQSTPDSMGAVYWGRAGRQGTRANQWPSAHTNRFISNSEHDLGATQKQLWGTQPRLTHRGPCLGRQHTDMPGTGQRTKPWTIKKFAAGNQVGIALATRDEEGRIQVSIIQSQQKYFLTLP